MIAKKQRRSVLNNSVENSIQEGVRLWLDDERDPKNAMIQKCFGAHGDEVWVKTVEDARKIIIDGYKDKSKQVVYISFDHDLGDGNRDGIDLAKWIEEQAFYNRISFISWNVHSANPSGAKNIKTAMESANRFWNIYES